MSERDCDSRRSTDSTLAASQPEERRHARSSARETRPSWSAPIATPRWSRASSREIAGTREYRWLASERAAASGRTCDTCGSSARHPTPFVAFEALSRERSHMLGAASKCSTARHPATLTATPTREVRHRVSGCATDGALVCDDRRTGESMMRFASKSHETCSNTSLSGTHSSNIKTLSISLFNSA